MWITLSAYSLTSPITGYRIERGAKAGQLGKPQLVTADTGRVKYKPPAGTGPGRDSFSYEVQSVAGVSAPAEVHITITDKDPVLVAANDLEFSQVLVGGSVRRTLVLQNMGGSLAEGTVKTPEGWTVEGNADYRLGAGEKQTFTVIFKPSEERVYTGDIEYTGNLERATDLNGEGVGPVAVTSGTVELRGAGMVRMGTIHIENRSGAVEALQVAAGPLLDATLTVTVPANGEADLVVRARGDGEIHGSVTLEGDGVKRQVPVHAAAETVPRRSPVAIVPVKSPERAPVRPATPVERVRELNAAAPTVAAANAGESTANLPLPGPEETDGSPSATSVWSLAVGRVTETEALVGCRFKGAPPARAYRSSCRRWESTRTEKSRPNGCPRPMRWCR